MRPAKIVAIVVGAILVLVGLGLLAPGGLLLGIYGTQRDSAGFFETSDRMLSTDGYALVTPDVNLDLGPEIGNWAPVGARAAVRIRATSTAGDALFLGIGPSDEVSRYLENVAHDEVTDFAWFSATVGYASTSGEELPSLPDQQDFWVALQEGSGTQTLEWDIRDGSWTAVLMNADAGQRVTANVSLGARFELLLPIAIGLTIGGIVLLAVGVFLIVVGVRRPQQALQAQPPAGAWAPTPPTTPGPPPGAPAPPPATPGEPQPAAQERPPTTLEQPPQD